MNFESENNTCNNKKVKYIKSLFKNKTKLHFDNCQIEINT